MLTQTQMAVETGLGITQFRKYLAKALTYIIENRKDLLKDEEVLIQEINGKPEYHEVVLQEIQKGIQYVRQTRYSRAVNTRKQRMGERRYSTHKSAGHS